LHAHCQAANVLSRLVPRSCSYSCRSRTWPSACTGRCSACACSTSIASFRTSRPIPPPSCSALCTPPRPASRSSPGTVAHLSGACVVRYLGRLIPPLAHNYLGMIHNPDTAFWKVRSPRLTTPCAVRD
jgi:hypothetical protein